MRNSSLFDGIGSPREMIRSAIYSRCLSLQEKFSFSDYERDLLFAIKLVKETEAGTYRKYRRKNSYK